MGMSIGEAISKMQYELNKNNKMADAYVVAIETMRKYQQIVQIYQKWNEVNDFSYNQAMQKIGEVLNDGNNAGND